MKKTLAPLMSHNRKDWRTEAAFFEALDSQCRFNFDLAASKSNRLCDKYYSSKDNALVQDWNKKRGWLNPPFERLENWTAKGAETSWNAKSFCVMLTPARPDVGWWQDIHLSCETLLLKGRLKFWHPNEQTTSAAPFPCQLLLFHAEPKGSIKTWDWREGEPFPWANVLP